MSIFGERIDRVREKTGGKPHIKRNGSRGWIILKDCSPYPGTPAKLHGRTYPTFERLLHHEPLPQ